MIALLLSLAFYIAGTVAVVIIARSYRDMFRKVQHGPLCNCWRCEHSGWLS